MTVDEALRKHDIDGQCWLKFLALAAGNLNVPARVGHLRRPWQRLVKGWLRDHPGWAYLGGMRDSLWAWVGGDREAYEALEAELLNAAADKLKPGLGSLVRGGKLA